MADQGAGWTSPGGGPDRDPDPPQYGERIAGWTPPPQAPIAAAQTYVAPPKPGLIPLHPLSFGQLLGAAFAVIRYNPRATVAPALLISLVQNVLVLALTYAIGVSTIDRIDRATTDADRATIALGGAAIGGAAALAVIVASVVGNALLQGILTRVVADGALGRRPTAGEALRTAGRRFWPLAGFSLLIGAVELVLLLLFAGAVAGLIVAFSGLSNSVGIVVAIAIAAPIGLGLVVLFAFLTVKVALTPSIIVLERGSVIASIRRSWRLTRRAFWRTFGLIALVTVMVSAAGQLVSLPFSILGGAIGGLLFPNAGSDLQSSIVPFLVSTLPALLAAVVVTGIGQIAQVAAVVLVYLDRRIRLEGLDLELQRFVEQGGDDPYERVG